MNSKIYIVTTIILMILVIQPIFATGNMYVIKEQTFTEDNFIYEQTTNKYIACNEGKLTDLLNWTISEDISNNYYLDASGNINFNNENVTSVVELETFPNNTYKICIDVVSIASNNTEFDFKIKQDFIFKKRNDLKEKNTALGQSVVKGTDNWFTRSAKNVGNFISDKLSKDEVIIKDIKLNYNAKIKFNKNKVPIFINDKEQKTIDLVFNVDGENTSYLHYDMTEKAFFIVFKFPLDAGNYFSDLKNLRRFKENKFTLNQIFVSSKNHSPTIIDNTLEIQVDSENKKPVLKITYKINSTEDSYTKKIVSTKLNADNPIEISYIDADKFERKVADVIINFSGDITDLKLNQPKFDLNIKKKFEDQTFMLKDGKYEACISGPITDITRIETLPNYDQVKTYIYPKSTGKINLDGMELEISFNKEQRSYKLCAKVQDTQKTNFGIISKKPFVNDSENKFIVKNIAVDKILKIDTLAQDPRISEISLNLDANLELIKFFSEEIELNHKFTSADYIYYEDEKILIGCQLGDLQGKLNQKEYISKESGVAIFNKITDLDISGRLFFQVDKKIDYNICTVIDKKWEDIDDKIYNFEFSEYDTAFKKVDESNELSQDDAARYRVDRIRRLFWIDKLWPDKKNVSQVKLNLTGNISFNKNLVHIFNQGLERKTVKIDLEKKFHNVRFESLKEGGVTKYKGCVTGKLKDLKDLSFLYNFDESSTYIEPDGVVLNPPENSEIKLNFKDQDYSVCLYLDSLQDTNYGTIKDKDVKFVDKNWYLFDVKNTKVLTKIPVLAFILMFGLNDKLATDSPIAKINIKLDANLEALNFNTDTITLDHEFTSKNIYYDLDNEFFYSEITEKEPNQLSNALGERIYVPEKLYGSFLDQEKLIGSTIFFNNDSTLINNNNSYTLNYYLYKKMNEITDNQYTVKSFTSAYSVDLKENFKSPPTQIPLYTTITLNRTIKLFFFDVLWPDKEDVARRKLELKSSVNFKKDEIPTMKKIDGKYVEVKEISIDLKNKLKKANHTYDSTKKTYTGCVTNNLQVLDDIKSLVYFRDENNKIKTKINETGIILGIDYNFTFTFIDKKGQYKICLETTKKPMDLLSEINITDPFFKESIKKDETLKNKEFIINNKKSLILIKLSINKEAPSSENLNDNQDSQNFVPTDSGYFCYDPKGFKKDEGLTGIQNYVKYGLNKILFTWDSSVITDSTCDYGNYYCDQDQLRIALNKKIDLLKNNSYIDLDGIKFKKDTDGGIAIHIAASITNNADYNPSKYPLLLKDAIKEQEAWYKLELSNLEIRNDNLKEITEKLRNNLKDTIPEELQKLTILRITYDNTKTDYLDKTKELLSNAENIHTLKIGEKTQVYFSANNFISKEKIQFKDGVTDEDIEYITVFLNSLYIYFGVTLNPSYVNLKPYGDLTENSETHKILTAIYFNEENGPITLTDNSSVKEINEPNVYKIELSNYNSVAPESPKYTLTELSEKFNRKINLYKNYDLFKENFFFKTNINAKYYNYDRMPFAPGITVHGSNSTHKKMTVYDDYKDISEIQEGYIFNLNANNGQITEATFADILPIQIMTKEKDNSFNLEYSVQQKNEVIKKIQFPLSILTWGGKSEINYLYLTDKESNYVEKDNQFKLTFFVFRDYIKSTGNKNYQLKITSDKNFILNTGDAFKKEVDKKVIYEIPKRLEDFALSGDRFLSIGGRLPFPEALLLNKNKYYLLTYPTSISNLINGDDQKLELPQGLRYPSIINNHVCFKFKDNSFYLWKNPLAASGLMGSEKDVFLVSLHDKSNQLNKFMVNYNAENREYFISKKQTVKVPLASEHAVVVESGSAE